MIFSEHTGIPTAPESSPRSGSSQRSVITMSKRQSYRGASEASERKSLVHARVRQMLMLERLCSRFHLVAQQLRSRHDHRPTLDVQDEYDVRDLLHALLVVEHDDIRLETWTPSYAGGKSRTDFILRLEQIVVTARMVKDKLGAKELGEQLSVDVQKYKQHPDCRTLVCFFYDPARQLAYPHGLESELSGERDGLTVRVIVAPKGR